MTHTISRREFIKLTSTALLSLAASPNQVTNITPESMNKNDRASNILVLLFDTLSARHMSLYGYERSTTPNFTRFAERANVYHNHYSTASFTSPGAASLITGVYPWAHQALHLYDIVSTQYVDNNLFSYCHPSHFITTYTHNPLAGIQFSQMCKYIDRLVPMETSSLVGGLYSEKLFPADFPAAFWSEVIIRGFDGVMPSSFYLSKLEFESFIDKLKNLDGELFERYPRGIPWNYKGMFFVLEDAIDWIQEQLPSLPENHLAYFHLWPPHAPYLPPVDYINLFDDKRKWIEKPEHLFTMDMPAAHLDELRQQYDEYVAFVDAEFGRLIDFMENNAIFDKTLFVITSDHGDMFERGISGHNTPTLYENIVRVPLLISFPNQKSRQDIYALTSAVDLLPSILQFLSQPIPDSLEGQVLPGFDTRQASQDRFIYAMDAKNNSKFGPFTKGTFMMRNGAYKFIHYQGYEQELPDELYNLENDPEEMQDLSSIKNSLANDFLLKLSDKLDEINLPYQNQNS